MLAIIAGAVMPALAHALAETEGEIFRWGEVCSLEGASAELVSAATDELPGDLPQISVEHCPYCLIHADDFALGPAVGITFPVRPQFAWQPAERFSAPRPATIWSSARPRAPPPPLNG